MPIFSYVAHDAEGKELKGNMSAESKQALVKQLEEKGHFLISWEMMDTGEEPSGIPLVFPAGKKKLGGFILKLKEKYFSRRKKISLVDLSRMTRQMAISLESGVNLVETLNIIGRQSKDEKTQKIFKEIQSKLLEGKSLSFAMKLFPETFSDMYVAMIISGETGGFLPRAMKKMAVYLEEKNKTRNDLISKLIYPVIMFILSIGVILFLGTFIIPSFADVFSSMGVQPPLLTRLMIRVAFLLRTYWYVQILGIALIIFIIVKLSRMKGHSMVLDRALLALPLFGELFNKIEVSSFLSNLGILVQNGVPILSSLEMSRRLVGNSIIRRDIDDIYRDVQSGKPISEKMYKSRYFPLLVANMVETGQNSGKLGETMEIVSGYYEEETKLYIKNMLVIIEPATIIGLGVVVGFIAASLMLPLYMLPDIIH